MLGVGEVRIPACRRVKAHDERMRPLLVQPFRTAVRSSLELLQPRNLTSQPGELPEPLGNRRLAGPRFPLEENDMSDHAPLLSAMQWALNRRAGSHRPSPVSDRWSAARLLDPFLIVGWNGALLDRKSTRLNSSHIPF